MGGRVHHPEPICHVDLRSNFFIPGGGGGYIVQNQKCHLDLKSNFFIPGGGPTSSRTKMSHWPEIQLFHSWGGGALFRTKNVTLTWNLTFSFLGGWGGAYIIQNQNVTLTWDSTFSFLGGGYIIQNQKCHLDHLDLKSSFFIPWGGGTSSRTKMSHWPEMQLFHSWGGVHHPEPKNVTLTWDWTFSFRGGGGGYIVHNQKCHLDHLDLKSNFFIRGGGGYICG